MHYVHVSIYNTYTVHNYVCPASALLFLTSLLSKNEKMNIIMSTVGPPQRVMGTGQPPWLAPPTLNLALCITHDHSNGIMGPFLSMHDVYACKEKVSIKIWLVSNTVIVLSKCILCE